MCKSCFYCLKKFFHLELKNNCRYEPIPPGASNTNKIFTLLQFLLY